MNMSSIVYMCYEYSMDIKYGNSSKILIFVF